MLFLSSYSLTHSLSIVAMSLPYEEDPNAVRERLRGRMAEFVRLVNNGHDQDARDLLTQVAYPNGPDEPPSPVVLMANTTTDEAGEWNSHVLVEMHSVKGESCGARVGKNEGGGKDKLCCRHKSMCTVQSRKGKRVIGAKDYG